MKINWGFGVLAYASSLWACAPDPKPLARSENFVQRGPDSLSALGAGWATASLVNALGAYRELHIALSDERSIGVNRSAAKMLKELRRLRMAALKADTTTAVLADSLMWASGHIAQTAHGDFARQRTFFRTLSANFFLLLHHLRFRAVPVYRFYDPAAFNDAGAYWLSWSRQTLNPYFGPKMSEWGELIDSLQ